MGFAVAQEARRRGAKAYLISGPTHLAPPWGVDFIRVTSAREMYEQVMTLFPRMDVVIKAAAVADFYPLPLVERGKFKKGKRESLTLALKANPDILAQLGKKKESQILVGFAAESQELLKNAQEKLKRKNLDIIVANNISDGFAEDTNKVTILKRDGSIRDLPLMSKEEVASVLLNEVAHLLS